MSLTEVLALRGARLLAEATAAFLLSVSVANADGRIVISSSISDMDPPSRILAMLPGTDNYVADRRGGWGTLSVPPGRYELMVVPAGPRALPIRYPAVSVADGATETFTVATGVRLTAPDAMPPLDWWLVAEAGGDVVAQVGDRWGVTPLPPGSYRIVVPLAGGEASRNVGVPADGVTEVALADLGVARVELEMPQPEDFALLFGGGPLVPILERDGERYDLSSELRQGRVGLWLRSGPIALERRSGSFVDRHEIDLSGGERVVVPFDAADLAADRALGILEVADGTDRLSVVTANGDRALYAGPAEAGTRYVVPGGAAAAAVRGGERSPYVAVEAGSVQQVGAARAEDAAAEVSLFVEEPADGTEMDPATQTVTVIGQATAAGKAGASRIVLLVDVSASTEEPSGVDLNGDGAEESVIEAEIEAARQLVTALAEIDAAAPGTQFLVGAAAFGDAGQGLTPMLPLGEAANVDRLESALLGLVPGMLGGSTYYDRGLDAAQRLVETAADRGPAVILLVTDGQPSDVVAGIDAAGRVALEGTVLHVVGLGREFGSSVPEAGRYPPVPEAGPQILAAMAEFGVGGSRAWALPTPGDVVALVPSLPVLERADAGIDRVTVANETVGAAAENVELRADGSFSAQVPVAFSLRNGAPVNRLKVTALGDAGETGELTLRLFERGFGDALRVEGEAEIARLSAEAERLAAAVAKAEARASAAEAEAQAARAAAAEGQAANRAIRADAAERDRELARLRSALAEERRTLGGLEEEASACTASLAQCDADRDEALARLFQARPVAEGVVLTVPGDVLFDFNSTEVRADAAEALRLASVFLRGYEKSDLVIEGHTDGIGSDAYNRELSLDRAEAVLAWLVERGGVAAERIRAVGFGESRPVAEEVRADGSDDPEGRQRNRRVEIRVLQ